MDVTRESRTAQLEPGAAEGGAASRSAEEPWPLATEALARLAAWPRWDAPEDFEAIAAMARSLALPGTELCLCLRFDPEHDGALAAALPRLEAALSALPEGRVEVLVVDDPMGPADWPRLGRALTCALRLPSSRDGARAAFLAGLGVRVVEARVVPGGPALPGAPAGPGAGEREARRRTVMTRWLDRAREVCVPYFPPVRLDVDLTHACNIRCAYCWQQAKTKSILRYEDVADVVDAVAAVWPPSITLTGGEPTTWPDFLRLVEHCADVGVEQLKLISNGVKLADPAFARRVVDAGVTSINLSVDTLDAEKFLRLRSFPLGTLLRAVESCAELRRRDPALQITLSSVVSREVTPEDVHGVKLLARKHGFAFFMQTFFPDYAPPEIRERFAMSAEERRDFARRLEALGGGVGFAAGDPRARVLNRVENPLTEARTDRCYKGVTTVKLHHDGGVAFCWSTPVIGNVRERPFMELWTSEEARRCRELIRDRRCKCNFDCDIFESLDLPRAASRVRARS